MTPARTSPASSTRTRAQDPRPARTRAAILEAITRLGDHGATFSIAAITREAGISRSSFYAQFTDLDDVAVQLIDELFGRVRTLDADLRSSATQLQATRATLTAILGEFSARRALYSAALGDQLSGHAHRRILALFAAGAQVTMTRVAPDGIDSEVAARFVAAGVLGTLTDWLQTDQPRPAADLLDQLLAMLPPWVVDGPAAPAPQQP
jgi:AcrR family transcriptional regulator